MVGCLDVPNAFAPTYHYCVEDRLEWCDPRLLAGQIL